LEGRGHRLGFSGGQQAAPERPVAPPPERPAARPRAFDHIAARLPHRDFEQANRAEEKDWPRHTSRVFAGAVVACTGSGGGGDDFSDASPS
jgi:hypothetical protein